MVRRWRGGGGSRGGCLRGGGWGPLGSLRRWRSEPCTKFSFFLFFFLFFFFQNVCLDSGNTSGQSSGFIDIDIGIRVEGGVISFGMGLV